VNESAIAYDGIQQRAARFAVGVVGISVTKDHQRVSAFRNAQPVACNPRKRFEGRACCSPAIRAMAIHGVEKLIRHRVVDRAAVAASGERTRIGFF
jgi:hypothetical protein